MKFRSIVIIILFVNLNAYSQENKHLKSSVIKFRLEENVDYVKEFKLVSTNQELKILPCLLDGIDCYFIEYLADTNAFVLFSIGEKIIRLNNIYSNLSSEDVTIYVHLGEDSCTKTFSWGKSHDINLDFTPDKMVKKFFLCNVINVINFIVPYKIHNKYGGYIEYFKKKSKKSLCPPRRRVR